MHKIRLSSLKKGTAKPMPNNIRSLIIYRKAWRICFYKKYHILNSSYKVSQTCVLDVIVGAFDLWFILQTTFWFAFSPMKKFEFRLRFYWSFLIRIHFATCQHWIRQCLGAELAKSSYLNQWWYGLLTHICVTQPQWVNTHNDGHSMVTLLDDLVNEPFQPSAMYVILNVVAQT